MSTRFRLYAKPHSSDGFTERDTFNCQKGRLQCVAACYHFHCLVPAEPAVCRCYASRRQWPLADQIFALDASAADDNGILSRCQQRINGLLEETARSKLHTRQRSVPRFAFAPREQLSFHLPLSSPT